MRLHSIYPALTGQSLKKNKKNQVEWVWIFFGSDRLDLYRSSPRPSFIQKERQIFISDMAIDDKFTPIIYCHVMVG